MNVSKLAMKEFLCLIVCFVFNAVECLQCGFGYSTTPKYDLTRYGLPPEGFTRKTCKSSQNCVYVTISPTELPFVSMNIQFCDGEFGVFDKIIPSSTSCKEALKGPGGCSKTTLTDQLIPFLPTNLTADYCCCDSDLCNCNTWNIFSSVYCPPNPATTPKATAMTTTLPTGIQTAKTAETTAEPTLAPLSTLQCGFGYSITGVPGGGFSEMTCKSAKYCVAINAKPGFPPMSAELLFCDEEMGSISQIITADYSCESIVKESGGCITKDISIANVPMKMNADICCCATDSCNCKKLTDDQCKKGTPSDKTPPTPATQNPHSTTTSGAPYECHLSSYIVFLFAIISIITNHDLYLRR